MNYHDINKDDLLNGAGIRVVLFVSGCTHNCINCHNPQTHSFSGGIDFDDSAVNEILDELEKDYVSGLTISGGDPFHPFNIPEVYKLCEIVKKKYPNKNIWVYTGYTWEELGTRKTREPLLDMLLDLYVDVLIEGRFIEELKDVNHPYAGSKNQRVIDVKLSKETHSVELWKN